MPKKFVGENSKAVAAKARKSEKAEAEKSKKGKEKLDAEWADDDKSAKKKQVVLLDSYPIRRINTTKLCRCHGIFLILS